MWAANCMAESANIWVVSGAASDASIITASRQDPEAFADLFDRHASDVAAFLLRRLPREDAEDLLSEVFRVAFHKRETFDNEQSSARPWLYGIASNLLQTHRRSEARRIRATARATALRPVGVPTEEDLAHAIDADRLWPLVANAIAQLPHDERDVLLLVVWEAFSYADAAAALAIPVGTVRSRLNRARRRLRELVPASGEQPVEGSRGRQRRSR
jgi:RNA polymerase sigma-70 factor (ECF subfamily)